MTSFNFEHSEIKDELLRKELVDEVSEESAHHSSSCGSFAVWIVGVWNANDEVRDNLKQHKNDNGPNRDPQPSWPSSIILLFCQSLLIDDFSDTLITLGF